MPRPEKTEMFQNMERKNTREVVKKKDNKIVLASVFVLSSLLLACGLGPNITPTERPTTRTPRPTFTPRPTDTEILQPTETISPTDTITATDTKTPRTTKTFTPINPSRTPFLAPTLIPTTESNFIFNPLTQNMKTAPNCGTVYMKLGTLDKEGNPQDGNTIRLEFSDIDVFRVTGVNENPGQVGFAPLSQSEYHKPHRFSFDVVDSQTNPIALSPKIYIDFTDCTITGQYDNFGFQRIK